MPTARHRTPAASAPTPSTEEPTEGTMGTRLTSNRSVPVSPPLLMLLCCFVGLFFGDFYHHGQENNYSTAALSIKPTDAPTAVPTEEDIQILKVSYKRIHRQAKLEFVHIPKTGGTAIALTAAQGNVQWGMCHWTTLPRDYAPSKPITDQTRKDYPGCFQPTIRDRPSLEKEQPWHLPPAWLHANDPAFTKNQSIYHLNLNLNDTATTEKSTALFAVVRNPYTKLLAEYYCPRRGGYKNGGTTEKERAKHLNAFVTERVRRVRFPSDPTERQKGRLHVIPQSDFVFHPTTQRIHSTKRYHNLQQVVDHVLYYEDMTNELQVLLSAYFRPSMTSIQLPVVNAGGTHTNTSRLGVAHLTESTLHYINAAYKDDFALLGYRMINPTVEERSKGWNLLDHYDPHSRYMPALSGLKQSARDTPAAVEKNEIPSIPSPATPKYE